MSLEPPMKCVSCGKEADTYYNDDPYCFDCKPWEDTYDYESYEDYPDESWDEML